MFSHVWYSDEVSYDSPFIDTNIHDVTRSRTTPQEMTSTAEFDGFLSVPYKGHPVPFPSSHKTWQHFRL
jgi:hypothetical protein